MISKEFLSGSTNGRGIKVVATATLGTTIHTAHATNKDEVHIWAMNSHTADVLLSIEFGGVTDPDDLIEFSVPFADGLHLIVPGLVLSGSLVVTAFAAVANVIAVQGFVNRIS